MRRIDQMKVSHRHSYLLIHTICWSAIILIVATLGTWAQGWENLGPKNRPGCMRNLYLHSTSNKLFASSPDGGVWVCDISDLDATPDWAPLTDNLDNLEIRAFGVAPSNSNVIYVANKSASLYRTNNGGTSWSKLNSFHKGFGRVNKILVRHNSPGWVYLGTTTGFYLSWDSGETWSTHKFDGEDILDIAMDSDDSRILYAGVRGKGIYKTLNRGTTWELILQWTDVFTTNYSYNPPRTTPSGMIKIALGETKHDGSDETPQTRTVAVKFGKSIYLSHAAGAPGTFSLLDAPDISSNGAGNYRRTESLVKDEWCNAIAIDPFDSDHILVGQVSLFNTTDGGVTWSTIDTKHEDTQEIQFHRAVRNLVFLANDGGVEKSSTAALSFSRMYTNLVTAQMLRVGIQGDVAVGNSDHNGIIGTQSLAGGQWAQATPRKSLGCGYGNNGMENNGVYADPKRDGRFYIFHETHLARLIYPNPFILAQQQLTDADTQCAGWATSYSNFAPYTSSTTPESPQQGISVDRRTYSDIILACELGAPFKLKLTRGGDREPTLKFNPDDPATLTNVPLWQTTLVSPDEPFVSVIFSPQNTGMAYTMTKSGKLFFTHFKQPHPFLPPLPLLGLPQWIERAGWVTTQHGDGVRHFAVHPSNDKKVYAITSNTFARTIDLGETWSIIPRNIPVESYYSIVAAGQKLFLGASDGVYLSTNEGNSWAKVNGNLPNVKVAQLQVDGGYLYAITFGRGVWRVPLSQL